MSTLGFHLIDVGEAATVREFTQYGILLPDGKIIWANIDPATSGQTANLQGVTGGTYQIHPHASVFNFPKAVSDHRLKQERLGLPEVKDLVLISRKITMVQHAGHTVVMQPEKDK